MSYYRVENYPPPNCAGLEEIKCVAREPVCSWRMRSNNPNLKIPRYVDYCAASLGEATTSVSEQRLDQIIRNRAAQNLPPPAIYKVSKVTTPRGVKRSIRAISPSSFILPPSIAPPITPPIIPSTVPFVAAPTIPLTISPITAPMIEIPLISPITISQPALPREIQPTSPRQIQPTSPREISEEGPNIKSLIGRSIARPTRERKGSLITSDEFKTDFADFGPNFEEKCLAYPMDRISRILDLLSLPMSDDKKINCNRLQSFINDVKNNFGPEAAKDISVCLIPKNRYKIELLTHMLARRHKMPLREEFYLNPVKLCQAYHILVAVTLPEESDEFKRIAKEYRNYDKDVKQWLKSVHDALYAELEWVSG